MSSDIFPDPWTCPQCSTSDNTMPFCDRCGLEKYKADEMRQEPPLPGVDFTEVADARGVDFETIPIEGLEEMLSVTLSLPTELIVVMDAQTMAQLVARLIKALQ